MTTELVIVNRGPSKVRISTLDLTASGQFNQKGTVIELEPGQATPPNLAYVFQARKLEIEEVK